MIGTDCTRITYESLLVMLCLKVYPTNLRTSIFMVEELLVKSSKIVLDNSETYKFLSQAEFETYVHTLHAGTFVCHYLCYIVILLLVSVKVSF